MKCSITIVDSRLIGMKAWRSYGVTVSVDNGLVFCRLPPTPHSTSIATFVVQLSIRRQGCRAQTVDYHEKSLLLRSKSHCRLSVYPHYPTSISPRTLTRREPYPRRRLYQRIMMM